MDTSSYSTLNAAYLGSASRQEITTLSRDYPFDAKLLDQFGSCLDWHQLSLNRHLDWNEAFITQFSDYWDWTALSNNPMLP